MTWAFPHPHTRIFEICSKLGPVKKDYLELPVLSNRSYRVQQLNLPMLTDTAIDQRGKGWSAHQLNFMLPFCAGFALIVPVLYSHCLFIFMLVTQGVYKLHLSNLYLILPQACTQTLDLRANKQKSVWSRTLVLIQVFLGLGFLFFFFF